MKKPELPPDEQERQKALEDAGVVGLAKEERFDRITRITRKLFRAPISMLTVIDKDRALYKSNEVKNEVETITMGEAPRDLSFCAHAVLSDEILIVEDATKDERFCNNPHVTSGLKVRFYVGKPIHTPNGQRVGTLCVVDQRPRQVTPDDLASLTDMSKIVEEEIKKNTQDLSPEQVEALGENVKMRAMHSDFKEKVMSVRQALEKRKQKRAKTTKSKTKK